jgi:hypothetical protein
MLLMKILTFWTILCLAWWNSDISTVLKPIHLCDNFRFLVGLLYQFHLQTLKANIYTDWIRLWDKISKANVIFLVNRRNSPSTTPLWSKHPKTLHKQFLYTNINIYKCETKNIIEDMREVWLTTSGYWTDLLVVQLCLHGTKKTSPGYWTSSLVVKKCRVKGEMRNTHWILLAQNTSDDPGS